jgi:hypothetical protein
MPSWGIRCPPATTNPLTMAGLSLLGGSGSPWPWLYLRRSQSCYGSRPRGNHEVQMTDDDTEEAPTLFDQHDGVDWLLAWVVSLAERGLEMGITLSVGGSLITGTVISGRTYFEQMSEAMKSANYSGEPADDVPEIMAKSFLAFTKIYPADRAEVDWDAHKPAFIHLRHATILKSETHYPSGDGTYFRAKLASVDGFLVGTLDPS